MSSAAVVSKTPNPPRLNQIQREIEELLRRLHLKQNPPPNLQPPPQHFSRGWRFLFYILGIAALILGIKDATDEKSSKVGRSPVPQASAPDHARYQWVGFHRV